MKTIVTKDGYLTLCLHPKNIDNTETILKEIGNSIGSGNKVIYFSLRHNVIDGIYALLYKSRLTKKLIKQVYFVDLPSINVSAISDIVDRTRPNMVFIDSLLFLDLPETYIENRTIKECSKCFMQMMKELAKTANRCVCSIVVSGFDSIFNKSEINILNREGNIIFQDVYKTEKNKIL